ncbi:MAG TPA: glycosyltransferase, partial [bacterium]|nr:glycosyltransferase [bacterium]
PTARNWRLVIVGDGDMRASYEDLARALGVADRVIFAGALSDTDLVRAYKAADVHVLPSTTKSEAFGLVTLEAAASGLPSIVTNLPGVRTLVEPGVTGFVVEPNVEEELETAMAEFLHNPLLAKAMGSAARERVLDEYAQPVLASRLREVYNSVTVSG